MKPNSKVDCNEVMASRGYDIVAAPKAKSNAPFFYSVKVADGNYKVTVVLGSKKKAGKTVVRAENRRLMLDEVSTRKGEFKTFSFVVNKRSPYITDKMNVKIKPREKETFTWDEKLTLEFTGAAPAVKGFVALHIGCLIVQTALCAG